MATAPDSPSTFVVHPRSQSVGADLLMGAQPDIQYSDGTNSANGEDYGYATSRQDSLPTEMLTPDGDRHDPMPVSPVISEFDERYDSAATSREVSSRHASKQNVSRTKYDHTVSQEELRERPHVHARTYSGQANGQPKPILQNRRPQSTPRKNLTAVKQNYSRPTSPDRSPHVGYGPGDRSSAESIISQETEATSISTLPALQTKGPDNSDAQHLEPVLEDDPASWDLVDPPDESGGPQGRYALEKRAEQMFSAEHLRALFDDPKLLLKFTGYLNAHRPKSIAILIYYLDALKAIRAINYANAIAEALEPIRALDFTEQPAAPTKNTTLEKQAQAAFDMMVQEDLPAFIAHIWTQVVSVSIQRRITGTLAPHLREASEGLAEVFCLTDPSRADNPIVFASEEFVRTTQYGMNYVIGRNCRFLQGPHTNPNSVRRFAIANSEGREHTEVFVNYRRDGSPFMNLLMTAPLMDSRGTVRYFIGAQVDVSGLVKECSHLDGLLKMVEKESDPDADDESHRKDEFQELTEMFNSAELDTVRRFGGRMHKEYIDESDRESMTGDRRRVLIKDSSQEVLEKHGGQSTSTLPPSLRERINGKLEGIYQNVSISTASLRTPPC
jgi:PAS domain-containing protein